MLPLQLLRMFDSPINRLLVESGNHCKHLHLRAQRAVRAALRYGLRNAAELKHRAFFVGVLRVECSGDADRGVTG